MSEGHDSDYEWLDVLSDSDAGENSPFQTISRRSSISSSRGSTHSSTPADAWEGLNDPEITLNTEETPSIDAVEPLEEKLMAELDLGMMSTLNASRASNLGQSKDLRLSFPDPLASSSSSRNSYISLPADEPAAEEIAVTNASVDAKDIPLPLFTVEEALSLSPVESFASKTPKVVESPTNVQILYLKRVGYKGRVATLLAILLSTLGFAAQKMMSPGATPTHAPVATRSTIQVASTVPIFYEPVTTDLAISSLRDFALAVVQPAGSLSLWGPQATMPSSLSVPATISPAPVVIMHCPRGNLRERVRARHNRAKGKAREMRQIASQRMTAVMAYAGQSAQSISLYHTVGQSMIATVQENIGFARPLKDEAS